MASSRPQTGSERIAESMKISEKFQSNFLKADDLQGRKVHAIIASIGEEEFGGEKHLIVYFRGKQKALVLNKTNASYLANTVSDETDDWPGHEVVLYPTKVSFQGKMVDAIRVEMPSQAIPKQSEKPQPNAYAQASQPSLANAGQPAGQPSAFDSRAELDDEIPF
jgi:hypothetical protein